MARRAVEVTCHYLKCWPEHFVEVMTLHKTFEIRLDDRNYKVGDNVAIEEWDPETQQYSGRRVFFTIGYVTEFQQRPDYVVFSLLPPTKRRPGLGEGATPPYLQDEGRTHWDGCWRERGHHNCAVSYAEALIADLAAVRATVARVEQENEYLRHLLNPPSQSGSYPPRTPTPEGQG